ncbi:MAG TPA: SRPBCC domain-containing protein [Ramlibacter sp.]|uniref:SRPBCC family protein n=1 Tax=Ramlibacter sp. TaxID=1917967 RepID=UPI002ED0A050
METGSLDDRPSLRLVRRYPVAPEKVWRAWTDPQALSAWFGPGEANSVTLAEMDVREGGRYRIRFHTPDGEEHEVSGTYEGVEANRRLAFSWAWRSTPERVSQVKLAFRAVDGGTEMDFRHECFFDQQARDGHERGWTATLVKLEDWLRG